MQAGFWNTEIKLSKGLKNEILPFIVYPDGRVCISILHAPGDDPMGYETSAERWSPVQSVEKILLSVVSMLAGEKLLQRKIPPSCFHWKPKFQGTKFWMSNLNYCLSFYLILNILFNFAIL